MTSITLPFFGAAKTRPSFDAGPIIRSLAGALAITATIICLFAIARGLSGASAYHPGVRNIAILIHVATVVPAIPLGGFLLVARKGGPRHKMLGKIWISLMVTTAIAITFVRGGTDFSWIHIFVPLTLVGSWQIVSTARKGKMQQHKAHVYNLFFGALLIPGAFSFLPGRLMGVWLYG